MAKTIFVNLPVTNLARSIAFYGALGARQNDQFSDDTAAMMSFSEEINVMLLTHDKYRQFTAKPIADAHATSQVLLALSVDSREAVDSTFETALAAGGAPARETEDHGWMYCRAFEDPDGHVWEPFWMDVAAATRATGENVPA
jgi:hypothetical protein